MTLMHGAIIINCKMMCKVKKTAVLNFFLSLYFLYFTGWLQFHHGHDAVDYLNLGDSASRVVVVGPHCHSSKATFPLFENHKIITRPRIDCLLCTFNDWLFLRSPGNVINSILKFYKSDKLPFESVSHKPASSNYRLRAPPVSFPSDCISAQA